MLGNLLPRSSDNPIHCINFTFHPKKPIMRNPTRRAFLRSASATLALPFLPSFMYGKTASKAPQRLVCVGTQLGWYKPDFSPTTLVLASSNPSTLLV